MYNKFIFQILDIKYFKCIFIVFLFYFFNFSEIILAQLEKKTVMSILDGRHWSLNKKQFIELGEETENILINIAGDIKIINYLRFRAIEALVLFPSEKTSKFLEKTAERSFSPLARRSFKVFSRAFAKKNPERVRKLSLRLLKHPKAAIRISAARYIRTIDESTFKKFIKSEKDSFVIEEAQK